MAANWPIGLHLRPVFFYFLRIFSLFAPIRPKFPLSSQPFYFETRLSRHRSASDQVVTPLRPERQMLSSVKIELKTT